MRSTSIFFAVMLRLCHLALSGTHVCLPALEDAVAVEKSNDALHHRRRGHVEAGVLELPLQHLVHSPPQFLHERAHARAGFDTDPPVHRDGIVERLHLEVAAEEQQAEGLDERTVAHEGLRRLGELVVHDPLTRPLTLVEQHAARVDLDPLQLLHNVVDVPVLAAAAVTAIVRRPRNGPRFGIDEELHFLGLAELLHGAAQSLHVLLRTLHDAHHVGIEARQYGGAEDLVCAVAKARTELLSCLAAPRQEPDRLQALAELAPRLVHVFHAIRIYAAVHAPASRGATTSLRHLLHVLEVSAYHGKVV
mmetsp:Transcript_1521/g.4133  ORF Transcript_1521/g.4133 Transcript_1521/m.4133 type:complete len:306 (-) Transcript_1521:952-1869(-)